MIEKLKVINELSDNLDANGSIIGEIRTIRNPNTKELMDKINEIIEVVNSTIR
jgi:hypothetical protein